MSIEDRALMLFPTNEYYRNEWIHWTNYLVRTGKHVLLTGRYPRS